MTQMGNISKKDLEHLSALARIHISEAEEAKFGTDLGKILDHFKELEALDTSAVEAMSGGTLLKNVFRSDDERQNTNQGKGVDNFPETKDGYLKVPAVFEQ